MVIECGQGGLGIDRGPLQRCAYWDVEAGEGCEDASGALHVAFLPLTVGSFTPNESRNTHAQRIKEIQRKKTHL